MMHDDHCGHNHCCCGCCCCNGKDSKHEHGGNWEEYMKKMDKGELMMKKEKLEKKLTMINKLLEEKK
jgi:hypothetical protein